ncbi:homeobox-leucine zipper protein 3 [Hibiscus trionum]|uniref:Homeobox-leucine zipper protein 3 n=1 Tax=Hibiscus trionum TaxID=183268 RepID=A0A9W7JJZ9_HIBTR|nr:homeobox-leucine zipper protein 3 [Hibiscus trionum]
MGDDKDDGLWLSLSLGCAQYQPSSKLSLMSSASHPMQNLQPKNIWNQLFQSSDGQLDTRSFLKGIDVNRAPAAGDCEEEGWVSSPNSTISSISGKKNERDHVSDETEAERDSCSRASDDEDGAAASRKKLRLSKEQSLVLEETFKEHTTLNPKQKLALAKQLNLRPRQVEVWFQNRRARTKLKQTEVDCEYLKRCCENLTHKNQRLHKEVQELRALKLSPVPQLYKHMNPPTTLTMCPSCQGVAVSSSAPTSTAPNCRQMSPNHQQPLGSRANY